MISNHKQPIHSLHSPHSISPHTTVDPHQGSYTHFIQLTSHNSFNSLHSSHLIQLLSPLTHFTHLTSRNGQRPNHLLYSPTYFTTNIPIHVFIRSRYHTINNPHPRFSLAHLTRLSIPAHLLHSLTAAFAHLKRLSLAHLLHSLTSHVCRSPSTRIIVSL
jgi:hypothetical protein